MYIMKRKYNDVSLNVQMYNHFSSIAETAIAMTASTPFNTLNAISTP
jgi:hypothetical protein